MKTVSILPAALGARLYWGWFVVVAAFLVGMFGFGLGFYGPGIYLVALKTRHGWSTEDLSLAITAYYVLGATLLFLIVGPAFERCGARTVVTVGVLALAGGAVLLSAIAEPWQVYVAFAVMSLGWATTSGAAINIIVAPWFERRRGLALSWAMNGATAGGVVIAPLLVLAIARFGFAAAMQIAAATTLAILLPIAALVLRPRRPDEHEPAGQDPSGEQPERARQSPDGAAEFDLAAVLRSGAFLTLSIPFALALTAQVGFLTHQVSFLSPAIGTIAAGWALSLTTFAAVVGRIATGFIVDRFDRRTIAAANFAVQALGLTLLMSATTAPALYLGCMLFGIGLGNASSLPGLVVQQEFPKRHFARIISIVVAINQFSFAFGPILLARLRSTEGSYTAAFALCLVLEISAAIVVLAPVLAAGQRRRRGLTAR